MSIHLNFIFDNFGVSFSFFSSSWGGVGSSAFLRAVSSSSSFPRTNGVTEYEIALADF